jgi:hypothetical protein
MNDCIARALKENDKSTQMIAELKAYERKVLYPLTTEQVATKLNYGVRVNFPNFDAALTKIVGLDEKED